MVIFHSYVSLPEGKFFRKNHGWWVSCKRLPESIHGLIDWKLDGNIPSKWLENPSDGNIPSKSLGWSMINVSQTTLGLENMASGIRTHWLWTAWEPCKWGQLSWVKLSRSSASAPGLAWGGKTLSVWFVMICDDLWWLWWWWYDDDVISTDNDNCDWCVTNDHYPSVTNVTIMIMMIFIYIHMIFVIVVSWWYSINHN